MRIVSQLIFIALLWAAGGGLVVWLHPDARVLMEGGPPARALQEGEITLAEAQAMEREGGVLWIDVRPAAEFGRDHIPGAENIPSDQPDALTNKMFVWTQSNRLTDQTKVVIYCASPGCGTSHQLRRQLLSLNPTLRIQVLAGGWPEWLRGQAGR
jgi:rhodanese-related sulfurtransferase